MSNETKHDELENTKNFVNNFEHYQEKEALKRILHYASEEAKRLDFKECVEKILIAAAILEKEYSNKLSQKYI